MPHLSISRNILQTCFYVNVYSVRCVMCQYDQTPAGSVQQHQRQVDGRLLQTERTVSLANTGLSLAFHLKTCFSFPLKGKVLSALQFKVHVTKCKC